MHNQIHELCGLDWKTSGSHQCAQEDRLLGGELAHTINREVVLILGWGRAILMQLAHPLVASGVADHSSFNKRPEGWVLRLRHTLDAMIALSFGNPEEVKRAAAGINKIHDRVHGNLAESAGRFSAGTSYSAHDPRLLAWVHATLVDSFLLIYELYVGPLSQEEKNGYCAEAASIEPLLGIPEGYLPRSLDELHAYMKEMINGEMAITTQAREVANQVLYPPVPWFMRPVLSILNQPTIGLLPTEIRRQYGFSWRWSDEAALRISIRFVRITLLLVPSRIRHWPQAKTFWFTLLDRAEALW